MQNKKKKMTAAVAILSSLVAGIGTTARAGDLTTTTQQSESSQTYQQANRWFVRLGASGFLFDSSASLTLNGAPVNGASAKATNNATAVFEFGYYLTKNISVQFTGGIPPTTTLNGTGTISGLGALGQVTYGPAALTANYHVTRFGAFQPYAGLGAAYAIIFGTQDGAVQNLKVNGAFAFVLQGGADYYINRDWSVFADVKHLFLSTNADGTVQGAPVSASVTLDPTIVTAGISYHW